MRGPHWKVCAVLGAALAVATQGAAQTHTAPPSPQREPASPSKKKKDKTQRKKVPKKERRAPGATTPDQRKRLAPERRSSKRDARPDEDPVGGSHGGSEGAWSSTSTTTWTFDGCTTLSLGGHLTFAGKELQKTSEALGYGPDVTLALGPKRLPISFGLQVGFDWFGSTTDRFTYDGMLIDWDLDRRAFWLHGLVRWMPRRGLLRPHVDLLGGGWFHDVSIEPDGPFDDYDAEVVGGSSTWSLGFGVGVNLVSAGGFLAGLSLVHLRGGSIRVPDTRDLVVQDDVLYYGEAQARGIHQWMLMLNFGGMTPSD